MVALAMAARSHAVTGVDDDDGDLVAVHDADGGRDGGGVPCRCTGIK